MPKMNSENKEVEIKHFGDENHFISLLHGLFGMNIVV